MHPENALPSAELSKEEISHLLFLLGQCQGETGLYRHYCHLLLWAHRPAEPLWPARACPCLLSWRPQLKGDGGFSPAQPHSSASLLQSWCVPAPFPTGRLSMLLFDFFFLTTMLALSISSSRADRIRSGKSSPVSHVESSGFFSFHWGKSPLHFRCFTKHPDGCREGSHGGWPPAQLLSPVLPTLGKASWILPSSITVWSPRKDPS